MVARSERSTLMMINRKNLAPDEMTPAAMTGRNGVALDHLREGDAPGHPLAATEAHVARAPLAVVVHGRPCGVPVGPDPGHLSGDEHRPHHGDEHRPRPRHGDGLRLHDDVDREHPRVGDRDLLGEVTVVRHAGGKSPETREGAIGRRTIVMVHGQTRVERQQGTRVVRALAK